MLWQWWLLLPLLHFWISTGAALQDNLHLTKKQQETAYLAPCLQPPAKGGSVSDLPPVLKGKGKASQLQGETNTCLGVLWLTWNSLLWPHKGLIFNFIYFLAHKLPKKMRQEKEVKGELDGLQTRVGQCRIMRHLLTDSLESTAYLFIHYTH